VVDDEHVAPADLVQGDGPRVEVQANTIDDASGCGSGHFSRNETYYDPVTQFFCSRDLPRNRHNPNAALDQALDEAPWPFRIRSLIRVDDVTGRR
jgi:hypothetical protein